MLKILRLCLPLLVVGLAPVRPVDAQDAADKPVPVFREPFHHIVFENQYVRVLDVHIPAHQTTKFHIHPNPLTGVTIHDEMGWEQILGKEQQNKEAPDKAGEPFDNWSRQRPYTHRVSNVGDQEIHYVATERLSAFGGESAALPDTATRKLFKEGEYARIYRITLAPGESTEMHLHAAPGLTVVAGDLVPEMTGDRAAATGGKGAGAWSWRNAGHKHQLRNTSSQKMEIVEIDWR